MKMDPNAWDWWVQANDRRQVLINRKHSIGLAAPEKPELEILQGLAESIMDAASPKTKDPCICGAGFGMNLSCPSHAPADKRNG